MRDGVRLVTLKHSWRFAWKFLSWGWKGRVLPSADANDVAVLLLLVNSGLMYRVHPDSPPFL